MGCLLEHKGYQVAIAAAQQLAANYPDVMFVFLGEGPDENWLKQQAGKIDVSYLAGFRGQPPENASHKTTKPLRRAQA
ncbi:glycosyltransferase [Marinobacter gelidimuriae]|uniref:glycosyltransferase n=1 Tax=Marinobacter gelidimuriae TaxID=2739064 RepID=UPI0003692636|nr:glycosyltransferase [Marinobacter gelidimuriae]